MEVRARWIVPSTNALPEREYGWDGHDRFQVSRPGEKSLPNAFGWQKCISISRNEIDISLREIHLRKGGVEIRKGGVEIRFGGVEIRNGGVEIRFGRVEIR